VGRLNDGEVCEALAAAPDAESLHKTIGVPQANKLENIRQLAAAVRDGVTHPAALRELLGVDARHFAYYRQAAVVLRVLTEDGAGELALTEQGRKLLGTVEKSVDERRCFRSTPAIHALARSACGYAGTCLR
jgi:hypothetical protein